MPFDWSEFSKTIAQSGDTLVRGIGIDEQAKQAKAALEQQKNELQLQRDTLNENKLNLEKNRFTTVELPQYQDILKQYGDAMTRGNTKLATMIKEKNQDFLNSIQDKSAQYGLSMPPVDFDILDAAGKDAGDLLGKASNYFTRYGSLNEQQRKEGEAAALLIGGADNRLSTLQAIAKVKEIATTNANLSKATGGVVQTAEAATGMNALNAQAIGGTANEGSLVIGAKPTGGIDPKDVGEAVIKQLDTFKSSPDNKPLIEQATAIANAATNLDIALKQDNPAALGAAFTQVSKAAGETRITDEDINRISPNPSFASAVKRAYSRWLKNGIYPEDAKVLKGMLLAQEVANGKSFIKGIDSASNRAQFLPGVSKDQLKDALLKDNNINPVRIKYLGASDDDIIKQFNATQDPREKKELQRILLQRETVK